MNDFVAELKKIPPVTRFLCISSLCTTIPVMLQVVSPYKILYVQQLVTQRFELWRVPTSFFFGSTGINYLFDFLFLYRTSNDLETASYYLRSHDYAWQLIFACLGIVLINTPLNAFTHSRPLLTCLAYLQSALSPPGAQTSLMGLLTVPVSYFPYVMVGMDLIMAGPQAAAQSLGGLLVGHLWWMGVHAPGGWARGLASAPSWMRAFVAPGAQDGRSGPAPGVHVVPPASRRGAGQASNGRGGGHNWGSGQRLGSD